MFTASLAAAATRIAVAILLDTAAFIVWDIGTRSPIKLIADVRAGFGNRSALLSGTLRFGIGALAVIAATAVSAPVAARAVDFTVIECWALVTALVLEQLVGPDVRALRRP